MIGAHMLCGLTISGLKELTLSLGGENLYQWSETQLLNQHYDVLGRSMI